MKKLPIIAFLCVPFILVGEGISDYNQDKDGGNLYTSKISNMTVRVKSSSSEYHAGPTLPSDGNMGSFNNVKNSDKVYLGDTTSDFHLNMNITKPKSPPKARPPKPKPAPPPPPRIRPTPPPPPLTGGGGGSVGGTKTLAFSANTFVGSPAFTTSVNVPSSLSIGRAGRYSIYSNRGSSFTLNTPCGSRTITVRGNRNYLGARGVICGATYSVSWRLSYSAGMSFSVSDRATASNVNFSTGGGLALIGIY